MFNLEKAKGVIRSKMVFFCNECNKGFLPGKEQFIYVKVQDNNLIMTCPTCMKAWEDAYWPVKAEFSRIGTKQFVTVTFKNGVTYPDMPYFPTDDSILTGDIEIPEASKREIRRLGKLHFEEQQKKKIGKFEVVDTWEKQEIHCKTFGGDSYVIPFRWGFGGNIELKPVAPDYIIEQVRVKIYDYFRNQV